MPFVGVIIAAFTRLFAVEAIKWTVQKALLLTLVVTILPVVLYNLFWMIQNEIIDFMLSKLPAGSVGHVVEVTGLGAWIGQQIGLQTCLSMFFSAVGSRFSFRMIGRLLGRG